MPELPEVELCRRDLEAVLPGRCVEAFTCTQAGIVRQPVRDVAGFAAAVIGRVVADVERRGKRLLLRLDDGGVVTVGFGLWAKLELLGAPLEDVRGAQFELGAEGDAARTWLAFTEIALANLSHGPYELQGGPPPYDALDGRLDAAVLARLAPARSAAKAFVTDDRFVLGVGNGYSDELLWQARVHPRRLSGSLTGEEWAAVAVALRAVLTAAIAAGGEQGFVSPSGAVGTYERRIHHHGGEPCPRCGAALGSLMAGKRETNFCPVCQPP